jgi:hypothetical protein
MVNFLAALVLGFVIVSVLDSLVDNSGSGDIDP